MEEELTNKPDIFQILLLTARPAAGKSEIIKFLSDLDPIDRKKIFHLGKLKVIDDFPFLWRWFEEDQLLSDMNQERLFTDKEGYFKFVHQWDLLIHLINLEYEKFLRDEEKSDEYTVILEFSRGKEHGGYNRAFPVLSDEILNKLSILYLNVSWSESLRKNRKRFNPDKPDSILEHGLPDRKLERLYSECDFLELAAKDDSFIPIHDRNIPYTIFENEDDVTTEFQLALSNRLKDCLNVLWENQIYS
jgi:hypothetical protein